MRAQEVELALASGKDLGALHALERRCHSHPWNLRHFASALHDASTRVAVLRAGCEILGFAVAQVVSDEMHIHNLVVSPERRRHGLGRWLLGDTIAWGVASGARRAFLEVRQSNWGALELYRKAGFESVAVRRGYYAGPTEDALVLHRELCGDDP
jgi:ribosomal-protein-alanine N-acetyltransferase